MIINCQPFLSSCNDVSSVVTTTTDISSMYVANRPQSLSLPFLEVTEKREELLEEVSQYESHLVHLILKMTEFERETHNKIALLRSELMTADRETYKFDCMINNINCILNESWHKLNDCNLRLSQQKEKTGKKMADRKKLLKEYISVAIRHRLRCRLESLRDNGSLRHLVIKQAEFIQLDEKVNKIVEIEILQEKAVLLSHHEMLMKQRTTVFASRHAKQSYAMNLQLVINKHQSEGNKKLSFLHSEIKNVTMCIEQGRKILKDMESVVLRPMHRSMPNLFDDVSSGDQRLLARSNRDGGRKSVTAATFALRAYMERIGHHMCDAVAADNHFRINGWSCRGYLKKLSRGHSGRSYQRPIGGGGGRKWLSRWFVFDRRTATLSYYRSKSDEDKASVIPQESICFQDIWDVSTDVVTANEDKFRHRFVVKTLQRTLHLMASTDQAMRVWVDVIYCGAAEGNSCFGN